MVDDTTYTYDSSGEDKANKKREEQAKRERDIASESLKMANERVDALREELGLRSQVTSEEATQLSLTKQVAKEALNYIGKQSEGLRNSKSIQKDLNKADALSNKLKTINNDKLTGANKITKDTLDLQNQIVKKLTEELKTVEKIEGAMGLTGKAVKVIDKLFDGQLGDTEKILKNVRERLAEEEASGKKIEGLPGKLKGFGIGIDEIGKSILTNLNDPITYLMMMFENSKSINKFQQELGVGYSQAINLRDEMTAVANASGDVFINSKKVSEAFSTMNQELGFIVDNSGQTLETMVNLEKRLGLASGEAAKLTMLFRLQGNNTEETASNLTDSLNSQIKAGNVALSTKQIFNEIAKTTAIIQVSLGGTAEEIGSAIIAAKQLGAELADIDQIAGSILNFESSIENELQAELLTGKQLNLERARLLALNNDLAGVADEIAAQGIDYNFMTTANRLEQEAVAEALGISRDRLASIVQQQEFQNMSAEEVKDKYGDQAYESFKALDAQTKLVETVSKLKLVFADAMVSLTPIIDGIAGLIGGLGKIVSFASSVGEFFTGWLQPLAEAVGYLGFVGKILKMAASIAVLYAAYSAYGALAGIPLIGPALGLAAAAAITATGMGAINAISMDDGVIGSDGGMVVSGPKGSIQLNKDDSIIAGTNLGGGSGGGEKFDYNKMASAMSQVQINTSVRHDSFSSKNQSANHGSYQSDARHQTRFA